MRRCSIGKFLTQTVPLRTLEELKNNTKLTIRQKMTNLTLHLSKDRTSLYARTEMRISVTAGNESFAVVFSVATVIAHRPGGASTGSPNVLRKNSLFPSHLALIIRVTIPLGSWNAGDKNTKRCSVEVQCTLREMRNDPTLNSLSYFSKAKIRTFTKRRLHDDVDRWTS